MKPPGKPQRKAYMTRSSSLARRSGVKARNAKRYATNYERAFGGEDRIQFVNALPCANCGWRGADDFQWMTNAHTVNAGLSRRGPYTTIIPLCQTWDHRGCHDRQHAHGWSGLPTLATKEQRAKVAAHVQELWLRFCAEGPNG